MACVCLKVFTVTSAAGILWNLVFHGQQRAKQFLSLEGRAWWKRFLYLNLKCLFLGKSVEPRAEVVKFFLAQIASKQPKSLLPRAVWP